MQKLQNFIDAEMATTILLAFLFHRNVVAVSSASILAVGAAYFLRNCLRLLNPSNQDNGKIPNGPMGLPKIGS